MSSDAVVLVVFGTAVLAAAVLSLEYRYAERAGRTLPPSTTAQLETEVPPLDPSRAQRHLEHSGGMKLGYKLVDLDMDDGRTFSRVWIIQDRWPTFSLRRALRGFKPTRVVAVRPHRPDSAG